MSASGSVSVNVTPYREDDKQILDDVGALGVRVRVQNKAKDKPDNVRCRKKHQRWEQL